MGTRAVYCFMDDTFNTDEIFSVYKHWDGYPSGAADFLTKTIPFAWKLPRFEPADFASAFITANKNEGGGDVYLTIGYQNHGDLEYYYEISPSEKNGQLIIRAFEVSYEGDDSILSEIFYGRLKDFVDTYGEYNTKVMWNKNDSSLNKLEV